MKRATFAEHINALGKETLMLLRYQFAFNRISQFDDLKQISRSVFVDRLIALKTIENDLLIRICKFDDETKGVHSFKKAIKEIPNIHPQRIRIDKKVKEFSEQIKSVKRNRRHVQLAHLQIGAEDEYQLRYDFTGPIQLIVEIIDLMNNQKMSYSWSDGSHEKFDLRKEVCRNLTGK